MVLLDGASDKARSALAALHDISSLDVDVRDYLAGLLSDPDSQPNTADELATIAGPFLESCDVARNVEDVRSISSSMWRVLTGCGAIVPREDLTALHIAAGGLDAETANALRKALGADTDDGSSKRMLSGPVRLGGAGMGGRGAGEISDFLWGRENNAYLNQNKVLEYGEHSKEAKKAAKMAVKANVRDTARAVADEEARLHAEATSGDQFTPDGQRIISTGSVTYVPVVNRKAQDISLQGMNLGYGGELLIEDAELKLAMGRKYG